MGEIGESPKPSWKVNEDDAPLRFVWGPTDCPALFFFANTPGWIRVLFYTTIVLLGLYFRRIHIILLYSLACMFFSANVGCVEESRNATRLNPNDLSLSGRRKIADYTSSDPIRLHLQL